MVRSSLGEVDTGHCGKRNWWEFTLCGGKGNSILFIGTTRRDGGGDYLGVEDQFIFRLIYNRFSSSWNLIHLLRPWLSALRYRCSSFDWDLYAIIQWMNRLVIIDTGVAPKNSLSVSLNGQRLLCLWIYNILSWNWHLQTSIVVGVEGGQMKTGNMNWLNLRVSVENGRTETTMYLVVLLGSIGLWSRMVTEYSMCVVCMCVIIYQPGIREGNGVQRQSSLANRNLGE